VKVATKRHNGHKLLCELVEEVVEVVGCDLGHLFEGETVYAGEAAGNFDDVSRLVPFAAIWNRAEVWAVGFDQQPVERDFFYDGAEFVSFLEGDDAGE